MTANGAAGKRFIAACASPVDMATVASVLREAGYRKVPSLRAPTFLLKLIGLFDLQMRGMLPFIGRAASFDNSETHRVLSWNETPIETSLREMAAAISKQTVEAI